MPLLKGIKAIHQDASAGRPHIFGHQTARSVANDTLFEVWNGPTVAGIKAAVDKDGKIYSAALTAGDILYAVTGGIANVRRLDSLVIGGSATYLRSNGTVPAWATISATEITTGNLPQAQLPSGNVVWTQTSITAGNIQLNVANTAKILVDGTEATMAVDTMGIHENVGNLVMTARGSMFFNVDNIAAPVGTKVYAWQSNGTTFMQLAFGSHALVLGQELTTDNSNASYTVNCGTNAGANNKDAYLEVQRGTTALWRAGVLGSVSTTNILRFRDVTNSLTVFQLNASATAPLVAVAGDTTTGDVTTALLINGGTNAGANNRDAYLDWQRGQTSLWRAGILGSVGTGGEFRIRDVANSRDALLINAAGGATAFQIQRSLTTQNIDIVLTVNSGTNSGANDKACLVRFQRGGTDLWDVGIAGAIATDGRFRFFDKVSSVTVLEVGLITDGLLRLAPSATTGNTNAILVLNAGTNAGANDKGAYIEHTRGGTILWRAGVIGSSGSGGEWILRDVVNTREPIVVTPGSQPAVTVNGVLIAAGVTNDNGLLVASHSLTGSNASALVSLAGTWNTSGSPAAIELNITNTGSGANAKLLDLKIGGTSMMYLGKAADLALNGTTPIVALQTSVTTRGFMQWDGTRLLVVSTVSLWLASGNQTSAVWEISGSTAKMKHIGTGGLVCANAALGTSSTTGFLYIPSCAGTPNGTPSAETGTIPLVYDSTNHILYAYSGGSWRTH